MGTIYRRPRSRFYWIKYVSGGKTHFESTKSEKLKVAQAILRRHEGDIANGIDVTPKLNKITFEEAKNALIADYEAKGLRSLYDVKIMIARHLKPAFSGLLLSAITTDKMTAYRVERKAAGAADASINREIAALRRMFRLAKRARKISDVPYFPMVKEDNARKGFFEREQFDTVLKHLPERLRGIATIGYFTGWRREEITGLEWRNVDRRAGELRIDTSKNGEGRTVPYSEVPELKTGIDAQWKAHQALATKGTINPWVFPGRGTNRVRSFRKAWKAATKAAGCPGRLFHDFRRTAVRNLTRAGVPRPIAMAITDHKTEAVFRRYDIVDSRDRREAMRKIAGVTL